MRSLIQILIDDDHVSMGTPQAPPNQDLGVFKNHFPKHNNNVNQVSTLASSSRQVIYNGPLQLDFMGMMHVEPIYVTTCTRRGSERVPPLRENRA